MSFNASSFRNKWVTLFGTVTEKTFRCFLEKFAIQISNLKFESQVFQESIENKRRFGAKKVFGSNNSEINKTILKQLTRFYISWNSSYPDLQIQFKKLKKLSKFITLKLPGCFKPDGKNRMKTLNIGNECRLNFNRQKPNTQSEPKFKN